MKRRRRTPDPARDRAYLDWHYTLERFLDEAVADALSMFDLDSIEMDKATNRPCAVVETTEMRAEDKPAYWTKKIAEALDVPGYVVQTVLSDRRNPGITDRVVLDIERFRVRRLSDNQMKDMAPAEYAKWLVNLRRSSGLRVAA